EGKRRLPNESEADGKPVNERDERMAEGVLQPVRKIIGLPPATGREAVFLRVKLGEIMNVEAVNAPQPLEKVIGLTGIGQENCRNLTHRALCRLGSPASTSVPPDYIPHRR